jgi:Gram-negative bacterial TonB protein C-terminal
MRRLLHQGLGLGLAAGLVGGLAWHYGSVSLGRGPAVLNPEMGEVAHGSYTNAYFDLSYPLPQEWTAGLAGPGPSETGYYVLSTLIPSGDLDGTILISAQDTFFAHKEYSDVAAAATDFRQAMSRVAAMTIDREPSETKIAGRDVWRVDFSGVGLYRAMFVTEIRCHLVSFNLTTREPELLSNLAHGLDNLSYASGKRGAAAGSFPVCDKGYATPENILKRVEPADAPGPRFAPVPVRVVIDGDGMVKHVHVIRSSDEQRKSIEDALHQWKFKPPKVNGRAVEMETGLTFRFGKKV